MTKHGLSMGLPIFERNALVIDIHLLVTGIGGRRSLYSYVIIALELEITKEVN